MVNSFRDTLRSWSAIRLAGDLFLSSTLSGTGNEARISPEIVQKVRALSGVKQVVPYYETAAQVGTEEVVLGGVDLTAQCERQVYLVVDGRCRPNGASWHGQALASESAARKLGLRVNDELSVSGAIYTIRGIIQEFGTEQPLVVTDISDFAARYPQHYPETITVDLIDTTTLTTAQAALRALVPVTVTVRSQRELLTLVETLFNRTFRVTDSVRWIVFTMALLGIVSTAVQHVWERRREFRVSEVLGVTQGMLVGAVTIEAVVVSGAAVLVGIVGGTGIGWCLTEYINPLVFGWSLSFQVTVWPSIEACLFVMCVGVATPLVATRVVRRIVTTVGLADE
jgi:putative ABC transport system permease protein